MIDCHAHLSSSSFEPDLGPVLDRARQVGVEAVLVVGEDMPDNQRVISVCEAYPGLLFPCAGLHPDRYADDRALPAAEEVEAVIRFIRDHSRDLHAIGEVGLDFWYVKDPERRRAQRDCLEQFASLSLELDLPLNVHSRSAGHHALDLLSASGAKKVLMHAFDGKASHALRAVERDGYFFSIPPSVIRSQQKQKLVRRLPLEHLLLETDSPVLGPQAGERNEPANIIHGARFIAEAHGTSVEAVVELSSRLAAELFKLPA